MTEPYDFEFQMVPPAACNTCGALVQARDLHDEWHRDVLTRFGLADIFMTMVERGRYDA